MAEILIGSFAFRGGLIDKIKPLLEGLVDKGVDIESIDCGVFNPEFVSVSYRSGERKMPLIKQFGSRTVCPSEVEVRNTLSEAVADIIDQEYTKKVVKDYLAQNKLNLSKRDTESLTNDIGSWSQKRRWVYNADLALQRQSFRNDLRISV